MDEYFMWIHYERLHNHNKAKHNKTVCIFMGYTVWIIGVLTSQKTNDVESVFMLWRQHEIIYMI